LILGEDREVNFLKRLCGFNIEYSGILNFQKTQLRLNLFSLFLKKSKNKNKNDKINNGLLNV
jgi:hypothetical protein